MNKTTRVFVLIMALLSPLYAVNQTDVTLVGTDGLPAEPGYKIPLFLQQGPHTILRCDFTGGDALTITNSTYSNNPTAYLAYGGEGMRVEIVNQSVTDFRISVDSSTLQGGQGGTVTFSDSFIRNIDAYGGAGFRTRKGQLSGDGSFFYGGQGGDISVGSGPFTNNASGGSGIFVFDGGSIAVTNAYAEGGRGGAVTALDASGIIFVNGGNGVTLESSFLDNRVVGSELIGGAAGSANTGTNGAGVAIADGGSGLFVSDLTGSFVVSNSLLTGGNGGSATASAASTATGGAGLFLTDAVDVTIIDSTLTGGSGGTVNGAAGMDGASLEMQGSAVSLTGGALIGELLFSGTNTSTIEIQGTTMDAARQTGGIVEVNAWDADHFQNTTISDGTMNFNGGGFTLQSDGELTLGSKDALARYNDGFTIADGGGEVNVGLGTLSASSFLFGEGSQISTIYAGKTGTNATDPDIIGQVLSEGTLTLESNTTWTIEAGANAVENGKTFTLAIIDGGITNNITEKDVIFSGSGGQAGWLGGIRSLDVIADLLLQATYDFSTIDSALGVDGDTSTEFGKAMNDLADILEKTSNTAAYADISQLATSVEEGEILMTNSYVRATEMASALVGLQSLISDQIRNRTRTHLRHQEVGYPSASTPAGASGWESMREFSDRLEDSYGIDDALDSLNEALPDFSYDDAKNTVDSATPDVRVETVGLPPTYHTWGRGYGSYSEQDTSDGFVGYDATIAGGILGLDRQINNMLLGIAGGYARTDLQGGADKDGNSDTLHAVAYFSTHGDHAFLDINANYAYNDVETEYQTLGFEGDYAAHTVGLYLGGGYAIPIGERVVLTPEASILNIYYTRDSYTEKSDLYPALMWDAYDQWSHLGSIGATLAMIQKIELRDSEVAVQPELRAHYLHEFNDQFDDETYMMTGGQYTIGASLKAREESLVKLGVGVLLSKWSSDTTEVGLDLDGAFGEDYNAYVFSGKIIHRF